MNDRTFTIAFGISLGLHALMLVGQLISPIWVRVTRRTPTTLDVVYEVSQAEQELRRLQEQLARARREAAAPPSPQQLATQTRIRIPERPSLMPSQTIAEAALARPPVVDLTNLVEASRGDPVLLSYFSAIREQIQQTANRRVWLTGERSEGLVYVSFLLNSSGSIQDAEIVGSRSVAVESLHGVALRIVKAASPFPPFPPSMTEASKTVVVPLEFLLGP